METVTAERVAQAREWLRDVADLSNDGDAAAFAVLMVALDALEVARRAAIGFAMTRLVSFLMRLQMVGRSWRLCLTRCVVVSLCAWL